MEKGGGKSSFSTNEAGAKLGTGYCDAQCPHDLKWINGEANMIGWVPSKTDMNAGTGKYGTCCAELDIWEANKISTQMTVHGCSTQGPYRCSGIECGDDKAGQRFNGTCDKDGCDFNPYRVGATNFYGEGPSHTLDSTKKMTVVRGSPWLRRHPQGDDPLLRPGRQAHRRAAPELLGAVHGLQLLVDHQRDVRRGRSSSATSTTLRRRAASPRWARRWAVGWRS